MFRIKNAFTLVELMVVIAIIAILAVGSITGYQTYFRRANDAERLSDIQTIRNTILVDYTSEWLYPSIATIEGKILAEHDVRIQDPKTGELDCLSADKITEQACRYEYSTCDGATGFVLSVRFESGGSVRMYDDRWSDDNALEYMSTSGCSVVDGTITF